MAPYHLKKTRLAELQNLITPGNGCVVSNDPLASFFQVSVDRFGGCAGIPRECVVASQAPPASFL